MVVVVGVVVVGLGVVVVVVSDRPNPKKNASEEAMLTNSTRNFILKCLLVFYCFQTKTMTMDVSIYT